jgi:molybdate transport system substrate-binding protein
MAFVEDDLRIVTHGGNPKHITGLRDLAKPSVRVAVQDTDQCSAVWRALRWAGVSAQHAVKEYDATTVLNAISTGKADAGLPSGLQYASDSDDYSTIEIPAPLRAGRVSYGAQLPGASQRRLAAQFVTFLVSPEVQKIVTVAGLRPVHYAGPIDAGPIAKCRVPSPGG